MTELRIIPMKCPSCGAQLEITSDMDRFACGYCGTQLITERKGGTIALKPLTDAIKRVQIGTDKTAAELAIQRLRSNIDQLRNDKSKRDAKAKEYIDMLAAQIETTRQEEQAIINKRTTITLIAGCSVLIITICMTLNNVKDGLLSFAISVVVASVVAFLVFKFSFRNASENLAQILYSREIEITTHRRAVANEMTEFDKKIQAIEEQIKEKKQIADG